MIRMVFRISIKYVSGSAAIKDVLMLILICSQFKIFVLIYLDLMLNVYHYNSLMEIQNVFLCKKIFFKQNLKHEHTLQD